MSKSKHYVWEATCFRKAAFFLKLVALEKVLVSASDILTASKHFGLLCHYSDNATGWTTRESVFDSR
jgi:hypothetical protein